MTTQTLLAHAVEAVITPPAGTELIEPVGMAATGVHDDLYARVLALSDGDTAVAIVALDLVGLDFPLVECIRQAVRAQAGLPPERLMLTTTHDHSAPLTIPWGRIAQRSRNRAWEAQMVATIAEASARALAGLAPARLAAGRAGVQIGFNRRVSSVQGTRMAPNRAGPVAPWVDVLRVDDANGQTIAVLYSHAAHAVTVHRADTRFTADFPAYAGRALRQQLGGGLVPLFAQGCCGDINVDPLSAGHAAAERVGSTLGRAAAEAALKAEPLAPQPLRVAVRRAYLPFAPLDGEQLAAILQRAQEGLRAAEAEGLNADALRSHRELVLWAERMQELAQDPAALQGLPSEVQGFSLGDAALLGLSHEMFVEYQLFLQQQSPFRHTMVFGYTNGCEDYVPTAEALLLGGYEVQGAPKLYGWPGLRPECERIVKETALAVLDDLWAQRGPE